MSRSWPAFAAAPPRFVRTARVALPGPSRCVPGGSKTSEHILGTPDTGADCMAVELDHEFTTDKPLDESYGSILDLERVVPAVEGGSVTEAVSPEKVKAEILMRMGAMSMKLIGTVEVVEKDEAAHTALVRVRSRESGGTGHANADVTFQLARRRRHDPHARADHRQGRVDGRGRGRRRARRADQGLHLEARADLNDGAGGDAGGARGRGALRRRDRGPGGPGPPRLPRQRPRRLRLRRSAATSSPSR